MPAPPPTRADYVHFTTMATRWRDNDVYAHMNNAVFYEYVDTAVNGWIVTDGGLPVPEGPVVGLVVASSCQFFASLGFPDPVVAGLRVGHLGRSSVRYEVGLFRGSAEEAAAAAEFTHVYVDSASRKPVPLPERFRTRLTTLTRT
ncbi:MAG: thioesterase family protein [Pseudomonadota bacterium]